MVCGAFTDHTVPQFLSLVCLYTSYRATFTRFRTPTLHTPPSLPSGAAHNLFSNPSHTFRTRSNSASPTSTNFTASEKPKPAIHALSMATKGYTRWTGVVARCIGNHIWRVSVPCARKINEETRTDEEGCGHTLGRTCGQPGVSQGKFRGFGRKGTRPITKNGIVSEGQDGSERNLYGQVRANDERQKIYQML